MFLVKGTQLSFSSAPNNTPQYPGLIEFESDNVWFLFSLWIFCRWNPTLQGTTDLGNQYINWVCWISSGFSSVVIQSLSCVRLFATPWTAARQASPSFPISQSLLKFMSIKLMMLSNHLILYCLLLFFSSVFPSIRFFSSESALYIRWPKYWTTSPHQPQPST